jgi:hypothetical protein
MLRMLQLEGIYNAMQCWERTTRPQILSTRRGLSEGANYDMLTTSIRVTCTVSFGDLNTVFTLNSTHSEKWDQSYCDPSTKHHR